MYPPKPDPSTVGELEVCSLRIFSAGAAAFLGGVAFSLAELTSLGCALLLVSGAILLFGMGRVACLLQTPSRDVICPHCSACNEVLASCAAFRCGTCGDIISSLDLPNGEIRPGPMGRSTGV